MQKKSAVYESKYEATYRQIKDKNPRWLTISPPASDLSPKKDLKIWMEMFIYDFRKYMNEFILVVEFKHLRMHFHVFYSRKDRIKEYRCINQLRKVSQVKVYDGEPAQGISYLFKDIDEATELLNGQPAIYTYNDVCKNYKDYRKRLRQKSRKDSIFDEPLTPKWMKCESKSE